MTNIGVRPTVTGGEAPVSIETHILDFDAGIYGARVTLEFLLHLREERRFAGIDALVAQIHRDVRRARHYFGCLGKIAPALVAERTEVC